MKASELATERLLLRPWRDDDLAAFAEMNADRRTMEYLPGLLSREESDAAARRIRGHFADKGFGLWAVEVPGVSPFAGFIGLTTPTFEAPFTPCVEVGWRLAPAHWGQGYATEGAGAALRFGFEELGLDEIVSMTVPDNARSRRVMERLGMTRSLEEDFDHPRLPEGHPLRRHVLYRLSRDTWRASAASLGELPLGPYERRLAQVLPWDPRALDVARHLATAVRRVVLPIHSRAQPEHIGSTAVPGMPGKGYVDLQLALPRACVPEAVAALLAAGWQKEAEATAFFPDTRPMLRASVPFAGTRYQAHLHVIPDDSPEIEATLAFRDALRASPEIAERYATLKRELVGTGVTRGRDFALAKSGFVNDVLRSIGSGRVR